jgi:hypothetical protein
MTIRKNCVISGRILLLYQFTRRSIKTDCSNYHGLSLLSASYKILSNILLVRSRTQTMEFFFFLFFFQDYVHI